VCAHINMGFRQMLAPREADGFQHVLPFLRIQLSLLGDRNALLCELIECEQCRCVDFGDFNVEVVVILWARQKISEAKATRKESSVRHQIIFETININHISHNER
jgi:hypothetical protein